MVFFNAYFLFLLFNLEDSKFKEDQDVQRKLDLQAEDGYTSLYFNADKSENDYEEVDQEKYHAMRSLKDSIMKEIRKDLGSRFGKSDRSCGREKHTKSLGKCVNVRPGLAMGVITLQAGVRGERITLT